ncbi:MAG: biosynthetic arginine decarboxylase [Gammaproteobacteria bacterium]|nr:biosynthetic arginine decarboxylase [Gammaproteobacteria bacterium]
MKNIENAKSVYNVKRWGESYFDINDQGQLEVTPLGDAELGCINLPSLCDELQQAGLAYPILVRFTDILSHRASNLISAFKKAKKEREYSGQYTAVYPIKVNQQFSVVEKLVNHHSGKVGLEAGSKPELMAILGVSSKPITIVCNGYKDSEFMRLACIGTSMGHKVHVVIEKMTELDVLLAAAQDTGFMPTIGIRIRLNAIGKGKWQNTGGEKGKFGLSATQVLQVIERLSSKQQLQHLTLVHFHIGSQIANIRDIHNAMRECARHYAELRALGVDIQTIDVGGGLGVDYEGSGSRSSCSMNYTVEEYAKNVIGPVAEICQQLDIEEPNIITESGRAMTAHHAMLITDVIDVESATAPTQISEPSDDDSAIYHELWRAYEHTDKRHVLESYHDALHLYGDAHQQYVVGMLGLAQWAKIEQVYFAILHRVHGLLNLKSRTHREVMDELNEKLADKLFVNFSLFQSLPDVWGIEQIFPVMPLSNLDKPLVNRAIVQDITCDSDGQIRQYADGEGIEASLPLPEFTHKKDCVLGMFMVGAYQEILGDLHNLFGDTDSVHVELCQQSERGYKLSQIFKGESVSDVLDHVNFEPEKLAKSYQQQLLATDLSESVKQQFLEELQSGLVGYTYFENEWSE